MGTGDVKISPLYKKMKGGKNNEEEKNGDH
jgi:hypothetical protein